jgi:NADH-quinone oxidoreductase subunit K
MSISCLFLSAMGLFGILTNKQSMLITLISIELMLYGFDLQLIIISEIHDDLAGQILALFLLTMAAAESAVALALLVSFFKMFGHILIETQENKN